MYACLHAAGFPGLLLNLALQFSPIVEQTTEETVVFCITPLRKLIGSPHQIAAEISRAGYERKLQANLAMAANPDSAILLARNFAGITFVTPGDERLKIGAIPLTALFEYGGMGDSKLLEVLHRWGLKTCEDLAALPPLGVAERLGKAGVYLQSLACGKIDRPLRVYGQATSYEEHMELEYPLTLLEPLSFLFSRVLVELCGRLRSQSQAARSLSLRFDLEKREPYRCELEFPVPLEESKTMLKLLQLHLERHPPGAAIRAFTLTIDPVSPRRVQGGIYLPPTPPADKLQITLARIKDMVGEQNAGTPVLLDTHRPDAFKLLPLPLAVADENGEQKQLSDTTKLPEGLRLVVRLFRPALPARVKVQQATPRDVIATHVKGKVIRWAGPWKTSGEWWSSSCWSREEWDVALDDGALYRIYQDNQSGAWFVHGVYD